MVAQVGAMPGKEGHSERHFQRFAKSGARLAHHRPQIGVDERARSYRVRCNPAGHPPPGSATDRFNDLPAVVIVEPYIE